MTSEFGDYTWQTLNEYIERRISGVLKLLQSLREDPRMKNLDDRHIIGFERELNLLRWCLPLISEMQNREYLKHLCPIMSLNTIRLRCRDRQTEQGGFLEFAWVSPIAEGQYNLTRLGMNESQESGNLRSIEAGLTQIVDEVEKLVKEICVDENQ